MLENVVLKFVICTKNWTSLYNKLQFFSVWLSVMETTEKTKIDCKRHSQYQGFNQFSDTIRDSRKFENEQFIVPWQMEKEKEGKILVQ